VHVAWLFLFFLVFDTVLEKMRRPSFQKTTFDQNPMEESLTSSCGLLLLLAQKEEVKDRKKK
jgi:hypothetical protein